MLKLLSHCRRTPLSCQSHSLTRALTRSLTSNSPTATVTVTAKAREALSTGGVYEEYMHLVNSNKLHYDEHQFKIIKTLEKVQQGIHQAMAVQQCDMQEEVEEEDKKDNSDTVDLQKKEEEKKEGKEGSIEKETATSTPTAMIPRGLYIFGEVGTGKTMMMDLFLDSTNVPKKRRVHFHKFMLDVHKIIHEYKQGLLQKYGREKNLNMDPSRDPILHCAGVIRESAQLLCFDEFQVTDIADAIIMTKLFGELWRQGTILVATSNRPPGNLYQGGLNRSYFLPFIEELEYRCIVRHLKSPIDYRTLLSSKLAGAYLTPVNAETTRELRAMFLADDTSAKDGSVITAVPVMMGREVFVEARDRICYVTFKDMCEGNRGAADYSALAKHMDIIYLEGVPVLSVLVHDKARRFITFIDEVYDAGKRLVWTSAKDPQSLFQFLTPTDMKDADFGTDHSWADLEAVRGETGSQLGVGEPKHLIRGRNAKKAVEQFEKDGGIVSMRFSEASTASEISFDDPDGGDSLTSEDKEIKLLEGELASIQELSFAFKRAGSRLVELSSKDYFEEWQISNHNKNSTK